MYFRFEKLEVWKLAKDFASKIYGLTKSFPDSERFGMVSQLRRAAISISMNIAEGFDRKSDADFIRFLRMSIGSLEEVITVLYIAIDQKYIKSDDFKSAYQDTNLLAAKINALIKSLQTK
ncbi:MAG: four helix bundle protein [Patescibacteria group bacterium]